MRRIRDNGVEGGSKGHPSVLYHSRRDRPEVPCPVCGRRTMDWLCHN